MLKDLRKSIKKLPKIVDQCNIIFIFAELTLINIKSIPNFSGVFDNKN